MAKDERKVRARALLTELLDVLFEDATPAQATVYGSREPYPPPPRRSHRWMRDHGPELVAYGATRTGGKAGKDVVWTMSAADFQNYEDARRSTMQPQPESMSGPPMAKVLHVDEWIARAGYRTTNGRQR